MAVDAPAQARIGQRVAALAQGDAAGRDAVVALRLHAQSGAQAALRPRQGGVGPHAHDVGGGEAGERLALRDGILQVARRVVGVAGRQVQAGRQLAVRFRFQAAALHFAARDVVADVARAGEAGVFLGPLVLADLVDGQGDVQLAIGQRALDARFQVVARYGVERLAVDAGLALRLEHLRVAAIARPLRRQGVDQAAIRRQLGVRLDLRRARLLFPAAQARARDGRQRIAYVEARHGIGAPLADLGRAARGVGARGRFRQRVRVPVKHVIRAAQRRHEAGRELFAGRVLDVGAQQQLVLASAQAEGTAGVGVHAVLAVVEAVGGAHHAGRRALVAARGAICARVFQEGIAGQMVGLHLRLPAVAKVLLQAGEDALRIPVELVPGRIEIGGAGQADVAAVGMARHARHVGDGADALFLRANTEQGARRQVQFAHGIQVAAVLPCHVIEKAPLLVRGDDARAQCAGVVQGAAQVRFAAAPVPVAG